MSTYLLDTNIYLNFYDRYYRFNFFPSFWTAFEEVINTKVVIPRVVLNEQHQDESFKIWLEEKHLGTILNHRDYVVEWGEILQHISESPYYTDNALSSDKGWAREKIADPWLIAIARSLDLTIVTSETRVANLSEFRPIKAAKIPDICDSLGVRCIDMNTFFEEIQLEI